MKRIIWNPDSTGERAHQRTPPAYLAHETRQLADRPSTFNLTGLLTNLIAFLFLPTFYPISLISTCHVFPPPAAGLDNRISLSVLDVIYTQSLKWLPRSSPTRTWRSTTPRRTYLLLSTIRSTIPLNSLMSIRKSHTSINLPSPMSRVLFLSSGEIIFAIDLPSEGPSEGAIVLTPIPLPAAVVKKSC